MPLTKEKNAELINTFGKNAKDSGNSEVQIALMSERIEQISKHLQSNAKDQSSKRGLTNMVGERRRLLNYLQHTDIERYRAIIQKLGIRK